MADEAKKSEDLRWLLEPPAPGEAHVHIAIGEKAQLTPAVREAAENLARALQEQDEVQGYAICRLKDCLPVATGQCIAFTTCRICMSH